MLLTFPLVSKTSNIAAKNAWKRIFHLNESVSIIINHHVLQISTFIFANPRQHLSPHTRFTLHRHITSPLHERAWKKFTYVITIIHIPYNYPHTHTHLPVQWQHQIECLTCDKLAIKIPKKTRFLCNFPSSLSLVSSFSDVYGTCMNANYQCESEERQKRNSSCLHPLS
jgi:hypothetical protein